MNKFNVNQKNPVVQRGSGVCCLLFSICPGRFPCVQNMGQEYLYYDTLKNYFVNSSLLPYFFLLFVFYFILISYSNARSDQIQGSILYPSNMLLVYATVGYISAYFILTKWLPKCGSDNILTN